MTDIELPELPPSAVSVYASLLRIIRTEAERNATEREIFLTLVCQIAGGYVQTAIAERSLSAASSSISKAPSDALAMGIA